MLFNSFEFLVFLPIVFLLYWFVFQKRLIWQNGLVLVASYFFYGWWSWKFMGLLMLSTLLDYTYGFSVASPNRKKAKFFLWLGIINNLGILGIFKYYNFFAIQFRQGLEFLGLHTNPILLNIALPVGISFYTFHGMSYIFDIYRGQQKPVRNFVDYAVFVSFFPLLVAGPIERASHLLPQVQKPRTFNYTQAVEGCRLMLWGLFKKVVIANNSAIIVDQIFSSYQINNGFTIFIGAVLFSFQIYCDFSGYSDIASGTAKLFGFELLINFRNPYFSRNIAEFWRRWHISLSSWFRDYLYIPLGGSKNGKLKAVRNTFIIFLVSGFWHGASWNFIAWGLLHSIAFLPIYILNFNRKDKYEIRVSKSLKNLKNIGQIILTFLIVTIAWIPFRISYVRDAIEIILKIFDFYSWEYIMVVDFYDFSMILILLIVEWLSRKSEMSIDNNILFTNKTMKIVFYLFLVVNVLWFFDNKQEFIYFQF
jgi:alginate O-acetyltransferase complex protein AlgI